MDAATLNWAKIMAPLAGAKGDAAVMQAAAVQTSPRVPPLARVIRLVTVLTPQVDYASWASLRRKTGVTRPYPAVVQGLVKNTLAKTKDAPAPRPEW